jgi:allophanate hydrolase subunit 1
MIFVCNICCYKIDRKASYDKHITSKRHIAKSKQSMTSESAEIEALKKQNTYLTNQIKYIQDLSNSYRSIAVDLSETTKISAETISFLVRHFKNAVANQTNHNLKFLLSRYNQSFVPDITNNQIDKTMQLIQYDVSCNN